MKIAFVGAGNMAAALIGGLLRRGAAASDIVAHDPHDETRERRRSQYGIEVRAKTDDRLLDVDVVVLAVKPHVMKATCEALVPFVDKQLFISLAAGVKTPAISRWLGNYQHVVRAMPNTPALVGAGITGLFAAAAVSKAQRIIAEETLGAVGTTVWVNDDSSIDTVTAISGSGPAYVFYFIEALQRAARELGLTDEQGKTLALATFSGAAQLALNSEESVESLRESVTSKGGTTAAALHSFATARVADSIVKGVIAARNRAVELGDEMDRN